MRCLAQVELTVSCMYIKTRTSYALYYTNTPVKQLSAVRHVVPLKAIVIVLGQLDIDIIP
jgi:hypothetical protein